MTTTFRLLDLPLELISQIFSYVAPTELAQLACTCRALRGLAHDDVLWQRHVAALEVPGVNATGPRALSGGGAAKGARAVNHAGLAESGRRGNRADEGDGDDDDEDDDDNEDDAPRGPSPFGSWREFYAAHYPYWFLPRQRIWIGDRLTGRQQMIGQVTVARYDYRMGAIEVYRLRAGNARADTFMQWSYDPEVIIHLFTPRVDLLTDDPVVRLEPGSYRPGSRLRQEVPFFGGPDRQATNRRSRLMLTRPLPEEARGPQTAVWPPSIIPAAERVRADSASMFRDPEHKPARHGDVCETAFRTRTWCEFLGLNVISISNFGGATMGEEVTTFSTLPVECYTPTEEKPYQGIWVGDYSGHGFEFLLLTQKTAEEARHIPPIKDMSEDGRDRRVFINTHRPARPSRAEAAQEPPPIGPDPPGCSGRLEAIKLTGDPNVPTGEYTFVAEDLGRSGFVRIAREDPFCGARIVRSWGHVASRGFMEDGYIPSQLIMVSHDCLAQFWEEFGHISYFKRIDIDQFLDVDKASSCCTF